MDLFSNESRRERRLQRLQDQANRHAQQALTLWRAGEAEQALLPNQRALDIIEALRAEEPGNDAHLAQLAGKLYNHAGMLVQAGRAGEAVGAARRCLAAYLELSGGELSPEAVLNDRLTSLAHTFRPAGSRADLAERAALTADAQCRLASLLAEVASPGAAAEALELATRAVRTYQYLVAIDTRYRTGLARVTEDFLVVRRRFGERA